MAIEITVKVGQRGPKVEINYGGGDAELNHEDGSKEKLTTSICFDNVRHDGNYATPGDAVNAALKALVGLG